MRRLAVLLLIVLAAPAGAEGPWHLSRISHRLRSDADRNYRFSSDGSGVTIYVIDSGTLRLHQEFAPGTIVDQPGNNLVAVPLPERAGVPQEPVDYDFTTASLPRFCPPNQLVTPFFDDLPGGAVSHGTAVASVAVGRNVGVAPGARVVPVKVLGCGNNQFRATNAAVFIAALEWVAANAVAPAVVSMSNFHYVSGCSNYVERNCLAGVELALFEQAVHALTDRGIAVVASANNQGTDACTQTPGRLSYRGGLGKVITVGGLAKDSDTRFTTSNFGACVDFWAPAEEIPVAHTAAADAYRPASSSSGTSFAAPVVAGIIARLMSEDPSLHADVDVVYARLRDSATRVDADFGLGSPNLLAYIGGVTFKRQPSIACTDATTARLEAESLEPGVELTWYRGDVPATPSASALICPGEAANPAITRINVPLGDTQRHWVRARRGELVGDSAEVTAGAVRFLTHPRTQWSTRSETLMLRATIEARAAGSYCTQWLRGSTPVAAPQWHVLTAPGAIDVGYFFNVPANAVANQNVYRARAWAAADCNAQIPADFGVFSDTAQLRYCNPPSIVRQPQAALLVDLTARSPRRLEIGVTGSDPVVTWFHGERGDTSTPLRTRDGSIVRAAVADPSFGNGRYWAQVGGSCGSVDSQPVDVTVCRYSLQGQADGFGELRRGLVTYNTPVGEPARLVVHALDVNSSPLSEPLHYVWTKDGVTVQEGPQPFYDVPAGSRGTFVVSTTSGGCPRSLDFEVADGPAPTCQPFTLWAGDCRLSQSPVITFSTDGPLRIAAIVLDHAGRPIADRAFEIDGTIVDTTGRDVFTADVIATDKARPSCSQTIRVRLVRCGIETPCVLCPRRRGIS